MSDSDPSDPALPDALPPRLASDLSALFPPPAVSGAMDQRILNSARAALAGRPRRSFRWPGVAAAVAAVAALVVIAIRLVPHQHAAPVAMTAPAGPAPSEPSTMPAIAGDIDGNGRVDILDAFIVARALADKSRTASMPQSWDVNHDGVVDQKDVDWIADAAVRVSALSRCDPLQRVARRAPRTTFAQASPARTLKGAAE